MRNTECEAVGVVDRGPGAASSDAQLLRQFRRGSQEAARQIHDRYARRVRALVRGRLASVLPSHVDAEDVVQSVFAAFFRAAGQGRYELGEGESLWKLLLVIALNKVRAEGVFHLAAKRDSRLTLALDRLPPEARRREPAHGGGQGFSRLVVEEALQSLPPGHREVVERRMQGHAVAEIARDLGQSERSVERILQRSRSQLSFLQES